MDDRRQGDADSVARVTRRIAAEPRHAKVMGKMLVFCQEPRTIEELDAEVASYPEMRSSAFTPRTVLSWLVDAGAIEELEPEENAVDEAAGEDATASDDASRSPVLFVTTEAGLSVARSHRPFDAIEELVMGDEPRYGDAYLLVLDACSSPQTKGQLEGLLKGNPALENPTRYASFFIDRLERAGAVVWDGGWRLTDEGRAFLESNR